MRIENVFVNLLKKVIVIEYAKKCILEQKKKNC